MNVMFIILQQRGQYRRCFKGNIVLYKSFIWGRNSWNILILVNVVSFELLLQGGGQKWSFNTRNCIYSGNRFKPALV